MTAVRRDWLERVVRERAAIIDEEWQRDGFVEEASELLWPMFPSELNRDTWMHAGTHELLRGPARCFLSEVAGAAERYLSTEALAHPTFDWVFADAMVFSEVNGTVAALDPTFRYGKDGEPVWWAFVLKIAFNLLAWIVWLFIAFIAYQESPALVVVQVLLTLAYQYSTRARVAKRAALLASMADVYGALDSIQPSWRNVYALMEKSRDLGAKWPTALFRLVEKNLR